MTISDLPAINASLNFVSTIFISTRLVSDPPRALAAHIACMITAVVSSIVFLAGYVTYHFHVGERSTHFTAQGIVRYLYFAMLISHILLAFVTVAAGHSHADSGVPTALGTP